MRKEVLVGIFATVLAVLFAFNTVPAGFATTQTYQGTYSTPLATYKYYFMLMAGSTKWATARIELVSYDPWRGYDHGISAYAWISDPNYGREQWVDPVYVGAVAVAYVANGLTGTKSFQVEVAYVAPGGIPMNGGVMLTIMIGKLYDNGNIEIETYMNDTY